MGDYLIAIGGTGSKIAEALLHLSAIGQMESRELHVVFVDQDRSNGNLERAQVLLEAYEACRKIGFTHTSDIFKVEVTKSDPNVWAPLPEMNSTLKSLVGYNLIPQNMNGFRGLYDILFDEAEKETSLNEGFRGHPSIGAAAFFKTVNLGEDGAVGYTNSKNPRGYGKRRKGKDFCCWFSFWRDGGSRYSNHC